jgi:hypothetical protein
MIQLFCPIQIEKMSTHSGVLTNESENSDSVVNPSPLLTNNGEYQIHNNFGLFR